MVSLTETCRATPSARDEDLYLFLAFPVLSAAFLYASWQPTGRVFILASDLVAEFVETEISRDENGRHLAFEFHPGLCRSTNRRQGALFEVSRQIASPRDWNHTIIAHSTRACCSWSVLVLCHAMDWESM